ncbi:MAG TPA: glycosyltransferase [Thermoleophilaceae bacterium]|jgi:GT2 family glycosyltransferase
MRPEIGGRPTPRVPAITAVIPTLGRRDSLARVLDRLESQTIAPAELAVYVVTDAAAEDGGRVAELAGERPYALRVLRGERPGASAARNAGWRAAETPLVLFLDDDVMPERELVAQHLSWHERHAEPEVGVLGLVRWADELEVTPFMRWLERGIQFDYPRIEPGADAGWGRFYTANASVKRAMLERVGGFDEESLPFGNEDLDLALRMSRVGFRLLYNPAARAEHLHRMDLDMWRRRVVRLAVAERRFLAMHPGDAEPYFHRLFTDAARRERLRGRSVTAARWVPPRTPVLGDYVWSRADLVFRQELADAFLQAWAADEAGEPVPGLDDAP